MLLATKKSIPTAYSFFNILKEITQTTNLAPSHNTHSANKEALTFFDAMFITLHSDVFTLSM